MATRPTKPKLESGVQALRRRAEAIAQDVLLQSGPDDAALSPAALRKALHELRVHQIELEIQNEELRRAHQALDRERARFFDLYDLAPVAYCSVSQNGQILQANLKACSVLGVARGSLLTLRFSQFIDRDEQDNYYRLRKQALETGDPQARELRMVTYDGTPFWGHLQASAGQDTDQAPVLLIVLSDVSERRQLEAVREDLTGRIEKIAARLPGMVYQFRLRPDGSTCFPYASDAIREIYRVSPADAMADAAPVFAAIHPDDHDRVVVSLLESAHGVSPWVQEFRVQFGDATVRWLLGNALAQREADGGTLWHGFITDVTERRLADDELAAHRAEATLGESRQRLRELVVQIEKALEDERKYVAREIHDELGQVLTALRMSLLLMEMRFCALDPALATLVLDMKALVDRAIDGVRNVALNLRPTALDQGLVGAVQWLCHDFSRRTGLPCALQGPDEAVEMEESRSVVVFRIVQESLTNITRYALASRVDIALRRHGDALRLEVRDDGQGFDVAAAKKKNTYGLLGMRERAKALGARLDIQSSPGHGTRISLLIPLDVAD